MQRIVPSTDGKLAVSIYHQDGGRYECRLYVNCNPTRAGCADGLGDATLRTARFKTLVKAEAWAVRAVRRA